MLRLFLVAALVVNTAMSASVHWSYDPTEHSGPAHWGTITDEHGATAYPDCEAHSQSPIDFSYSAVKVDSTLKGLPNPLWKGNGVVAKGASFANNGHALKLSLATGQESLVFVDPNTGKEFNLVQFHFHTVTEHTFSHGYREMEMHMVHQNPDDQSVLVVGVTFMASATTGGNTFLHKFWDLVPHLDWNGVDALPTAQITTADLSLADVLPAGGDYYTYPGSFTTPPCTEGVTWYVVKDPVPMGGAELAAIRSALEWGSWTGVSQFVPRGNYRPTQALNGRVPRLYTASAAVASAKAEDASDEATSAIAVGGAGLAVSIVALLIGAIGCIKALTATPKVAPAKELTSAAP